MVPGHPAGRVLSVIIPGGIETNTVAGLRAGQVRPVIIPGGIETGPARDRSGPPVGWSVIIPGGIETPTVR